VAQIDEQKEGHYFTVWNNDPPQNSTGNLVGNKSLSPCVMSQNLKEAKGPDLQIANNPQKETTTSKRRPHTSHHRLSFALDLRAVD
jgi:hypothetical protein